MTTDNTLEPTGLQGHNEIGRGRTHHDDTHCCPCPCRTEPQAGAVDELRQKIDSVVMHYDISGSLTDEIMTVIIDHTPAKQTAEVEDELEKRLKEDLRHTLKLVPTSQRDLFVSELADYLAARDQAKQSDGCPCLIIEPCSNQCTCAKPFMSAGCTRCCKYGSLEQRKRAAKRLAAQEAKQAALLAGVEKARDKALRKFHNNHSDGDLAIHDVYRTCRQVIMGGGA